MSKSNPGTPNGVNGTTGDTSNGSRPSLKPILSNPTVQVPNKQLSSDEQMDGGQQSPSIPLAPRQFKLISVNFKEAALDSPSFRASANHLDAQIENIEQWLLALASSVKKIPKYLAELQSFSNSFLEHLMPTFLQDGLIDQEYTVQCLQTTLEGLSKLWNSSFSALNVRGYIIDGLNVKVIGAIKHYKVIRANFEENQKKFDQYLSIYMATSKTKDASIVIEDAKQLFKVRKEYIRASLDLVSELSTLSNLIDRGLVRVCSDLWNLKKNNRLLDSLDVSSRMKGRKIQKIQSWCDSYSIAIDRLKDDMQSARKQVEDSAIFQFLPSKNLNDYKISLLNAKVLSEINETGIEKHGYLFMKTYTDKSSKPIWVRRWVFIKGGIFGLLVLSPSQTFVQETDKIGILLCNIKYAPQEERKFCFEVRTMDTTVIFQAENLFDLKCWLKVFDNERNRIFRENDAKNNYLINIASGRYPPIVTEFASTVNTTTDKELTSHKIINSAGQIIASSRLSSKIELNERLFKRHIYHQIPQIIPPFITDTTKSSIIAYSLAAPNSLPTALTANIWGSANWGLYYLHEVPNINKSSNTDSIDNEFLDLESGEEGIDYPDYYPYELVPLDIQMRALFETAVEPGELCLVSFRCIWSPNSRQELSGRCFITNRHSYFYMQSLGFIALTKAPIESFVSATCINKRSYDVLKLYNVSGAVNMKLFLDDGKLICNKLNYIIANKASDQPKHLHEVVNNLVKLDNQRSIEAREEFKNEFIAERLDSSTARQEYQLSLLGSEFRPEFGEHVSAGSFKETQDSIKSPITYKVDYSDVSQLISERVYNAPPRALFHVLLGDQSSVLDSYTTFTTLESRVKMPWVILDDNKGMKRQYNCNVIQGGKNRDQIRITDTLDGHIEDEYYSFTHEKASLKFLLGAAFSVQLRFVCIKVNGNQTKIRVYGQVNFESKLLMSPTIKAVTHSIFRSECYKIHNTLNEAVRRLGSHGTIPKAVYLYGKLSHTNQKFEETPIKPIMFGPGFFIRLICKKILVAVLANIAQVFYFLFNMIITLVKGIKMNYLLLLVIAGLSLSNLFLIGKTSQSYWSVKRASKLTKSYLSREPVMLQRAIYLKETQEAIRLDDRNVSSQLESVCYNTFKDNSFVLNYDHSTEWNRVYGDETTRQVAKDLKLTMHELGVKRHEMIVKLRMLNDMELELGRAEYKNWLMSEMGRCDYIENNLFSQIDKDKVDSLDEDLESGLESVLSYCKSCASELQLMDGLL